MRMSVEIYVDEQLNVDVTSSITYPRNIADDLSIASTTAFRNLQEAATANGAILASDVNADGTEAMF